jgi:hypothetical protein
VLLWERAIGSQERIGTTEHPLKEVQVFVVWAAAIPERKCEMNRKRLLGPLALLALVLLSCRNPFNRQMLLQVKDTVGPEITILSPKDGTSYAAMVVFRGIVADSSFPAGEGGKVEALSYEVLGTSIGGAIAAGSDGSFSFEFSTANLSGSLAVRVRAEDWNGNSTEAAVTLIDAGAIPSFTATPGNKKATFTWEDVPHAGSYSLHNLRYGEVVQDATSPYNWGDLTNGILYTFQLEAHSTVGEDNWSATKDVIPLCELDALAPCNS